MKQDTDKLISIIVPVFNAEKYLPDMINSILNQTYTAFELLLIDDGSTDRSYEVCLEFADKDQRVRAYHQMNMGASKARNIGISLATGRFIAFVDADDSIDHDYLNKLYYAISRAADIDRSLAVCGMERELSNGMIRVKRESFLHLEKREDNCFSMFSFLSDALTSQLFCTSVKMLIPATLIAENAVLFAKCRFREDQLFMFDLVNCAKEIFICKEPLYCYRYVKSSASHLQFKKWLLDDTDIYLAALCYRLKSYDLSAEEREIIIGLAIENSRIYLIENACYSSKMSDEISRLNESLYLTGKVSMDSIALWKKYSSHWQRVIFFFDKYDLLFLMPAAIQLKGLLKIMIEEMFRFFLSR